MTSRRHEIREDVQFRILRLLRDNPEMSQRDLAAAVGISNGSAHYLLSALIDRGLVKLGNVQSSPDRRRYAYVLTPSGLAAKAAITRHFLSRKLAEYDALKAEIAALRADLGEAEGA